MEKLLPEQLQQLWQSVVAQELTTEELSVMQERLTDEYRATWKQALLLSGHQDLQDSLLGEIGRYERCADVVELQRRCQPKRRRQCAVGVAGACQSGRSTFCGTVL
jgi:hypothetical protein